MAEDRKPAPTIDQRIAKLEQTIVDQARQIQWMQKLGGFTDSKTHSVRAARIEDRLELLEVKAEATLDVDAHLVELLEDHLKDRHDADLTRDNAIDVVNFRRIRKRLHMMAEKLGLLGKRRDLTTSRQDENRLRPRTVAANS